MEAINEQIISCINRLQSIQDSIEFFEFEAETEEEKNDYLKATIQVGQTLHKLRGRFSGHSELLTDALHLFAETKAMSRSVQVTGVETVPFQTTEGGAIIGGKLYRFR
jgi:hypothetical protein